MFIKYTYITLNTKPRGKRRYTLETETKVHFQRIQKFSFTRKILENFHAFETISLVLKNKTEKARLSVLKAPQKMSNLTDI